MPGLLDNPDALQAFGLLGQGIASRNVPAFANQAMSLLAGADQRRMQQAMQQMQMRQMQMGLDREQRAMQTEEQLRKAATDSYGMPSQGGFGIGPDGTQMATPRPQFDMRQYVDRVMQIDPAKGIGLQQAMQKDETPITVAPGASLVDRRTMKPVFTAPKEQSLPSAVQEYQFAQQQGYGGTFEQWDRERKKAGATNVSMKVDNKMGESLAGQVGGMAKDSKIQTSGAVSMFDAADRIEKALNSNKVIAGPGATKVQTVRQIAQVLGGGNDEGIRQTRQVIKSLAQMSVEARKQLQGQGQVTESEAAAVAKADAGDINDLTVGELRDLVTLTKRAAHYTAKSHKSVLDQMAQTEGTRGLVPYYQVQRMDDLLKHTPTLPQIGKQPSIDELLNKYGK